MTVDLYAQLIPSSPDLAKKAFNLFSKVKNTGGRIKRGIRGTTDAVENGDAKLVYIVSGLEHPEEVLHLKVLCEKKEIPYVCVPRHLKHGIVNTAVIIDPGRARGGYYRFVKELNIRRRRLI